MDPENDLEEQLTSYHICKLPTETATTEAPVKTEEEMCLRSERSRMDHENGAPSKNIPSGKKFRLEVFTVESARHSPQEEILGGVPEETDSHQRLAEDLKRKISQRSPEDSSAMASNSRAAVASPEPCTRAWYRLPTEMEVARPPAPKTYTSRKAEAPALTPTRVSTRATKGQAPLRLLELPDRVQLLAPPNDYPPPQATPVKSQRQRQNVITAPPIACIKIEDDDDDVTIVSSQPPPPVVSVPTVIEARHVIKLVTSVPVSKYPCEFCGMTFNLWNQRESHMHASHRINGIFTCFVCQKAAREYYITDDAIFSTQHYHYLQAHLAESHKITGQPRGFQCPYCSIHPASYEALVKHLTSDHDTTDLRNTYVLVNVLEDRIEG